MKTKHIRMIILAAAVAMIAAGVSNGGLNDTLNKGVHICLECIGIG
ncbi:MAG: CD1871A family CXXC motif-containing protein [Clostridia bacterium]|nr:CD1871A family CXXC motif-containing protein [Clostridia bacterium]